MDKAIVCVDDEHVVLSSLGEQLKRSFGNNYSIELAETGDDALEIFAELHADGIDIPLIISDQGLRDMRGDELLRQVHVLYPNTLKIMLTGQASADAIGNAVNVAKLYRYITKPWDETDLILTVKEALRRYTQDQKLAAQNEALNQANQDLEHSLSLLRSTFEATADGILVIDLAGQITSFNPKFSKMWGIPDAALAPKGDIRALKFVLDQLKDADRFVTRVKESAANPETDSFDVLEMKDGRIFEHYSSPQRIVGTIIGRVWNFRDITERKQAESIIQYQALHDGLTGLPNRIFFNQRLNQALVQAQQQQSLLAVMFLDLDRFKVINDTLSHTIGDQLLQLVVDRLRLCLRGDDLIARWGGDEFTLLLPHISHPDDATAIAKRILKTLTSGFDIEGHLIHATSSIGIALYPQDGEDGSTLLKHADTALYQAKEKGRNDYQHYTLTLDTQASELLALENQLHKALERDELLLHYQPQINTETGDISQMEALIRWQHPQRGLVPPGLFIPIAEQTGLIIPIGEWVLRTACTQTKTWQTMGLPDLCIGVNLSARQFRHRRLVQTITDILDQTGLMPAHLELEVTETATMQDMAQSKSILLELQKMGVNLAIDDFGTGYSSLNYLKQFPFHTLKIDQAFVRDLLTNSQDVAIVSAIVALSQGLNLRVVAEGVETQATKDLLQTLNCVQMQGYFFSRPLPVDAATQLLERQLGQSGIRALAQHC
jgi:diguanylate cyclase (GGDEF)-like protein/PAS domain S-box-containing protein